MPASARARSTTAGRADRWARLASSGTTPPNTRCTSCDRMTSPASSGCRRSPTSTAADVSSHDVSMPRTTSATARLALEPHGVRDGTGDDAGRGAHGEAGIAAGTGLAEQVRHDPEAVAREQVDPGLGSLHRDGDALGREQEAGEAGGGRRNRHADDRALQDLRHLPRHANLLGGDAHDAELAGIHRDGPEKRTVD